MQFFDVAKTIAKCLFMGGVCLLYLGHRFFLISFIQSLPTEVGPSKFYFNSVHNRKGFNHLIKLSSLLQCSQIFFKWLGYIAEF